MPGGNTSELSNKKIYEPTEMWKKYKHIVVKLVFIAIVVLLTALTTGLILYMTCSNKLSELENKVEFLMAIQQQTEGEQLSVHHASPASKQLQQIDCVDNRPQYVHRGLDY